MELYINNRNISDYYNIKCLDYGQLLSFAPEREDEREWADKSGVDRNLANIRFDAKDIVLPCIAKASSVGEAYNLVRSLIDDMFTWGCFVVSLREISTNTRECYLCERSNSIVGDINIRQFNSLYYFKLGLKDVNPNALRFKTSIIGNSAEILYEKGQTAVLYWGNGDVGEVGNSGLYTKDDYAADSLVDIIVDIDENAPTVPALVADFSADITNGVKPQDVQFTDESLGEVDIWSWNFGDGNTSSEQNPTHTYTESGIYTVTLQIFNSARGSDVETKTDYITIRNARLMINDTDFLIINDSGDYLLIN